MSRELLQQALDALENHRDPLSEAAGNALREALAAPQPEPYGHITTHAVTGQQFFYRYPSPPYLDTAKECIAVYAAPPAAPAPAVPLTDRTAQIVRPLPETMSRDEMLQHYSAHANLCAHEALQYQKRIRDLEKALSAAPADWGTPHDVGGAPWGAPAPAVCDGGTCGLGGYCTNCPRLSAAPVVREPLQEHEILALFMELNKPNKLAKTPVEMFICIVRAIEAAHGITGGKP